MEPDTLPRTTKGQFIPGFHYSPDTMFRPGNESHNKGKKFPGTGNCASFQKGNLPHNTKNDLDITIRTNKNGTAYKFIQLGLDRWEFLQKHNWMQANGPIPKGKVLACKNGDTMNCDPDNWELLTRGELAIRNRQNRIKQEATCVCGVTFKMSHKNQKYCSKDCQLHSYRFTNEPIVYDPINCVICGSEFVPDHHHTVICSKECRRKRQIEYNNRHKSKLPPKPEKIKAEKPVRGKSLFLTTKVKTCIICDGAFLPSSNVQKTCSQSCQTIHRYNIRKAWKSTNPILPVPIQEKHCAKCGLKFIPYKNNHAICSDCKTKGPRLMKCIECGNEFTREGRGVQLLCSDECKRARKNKLRSKYGYKRKPAQVILINCLHCGNDFEARNGAKYCSATCKHQVKINQAKDRRAELRNNPKPRIDAEKPLINYTCKFCNSQFKANRKTRYCSDECRKEVKNQNAKIYRGTYQAKRQPLLRKKVEKIKIPKTPKPQKLRKLNPKVEKDAVYAMLELNRNAPKHDREIIDIKKIVSPDLSKIEFKAYDAKLRITRFFKSEERYLKFLKEQQNELQQQRT